MTQFSETEKSLTEFGKRTVKLAKINLGATRLVDGKQRRTDNSGVLRNSLDFNVRVSKSGNSFEFDFVMEDYGVFVDSGRDGTEKKNRKGILKGESNRGIGIPKQKLLSWIKSKPVRLKDLKTGKFIEQTQSRINSLAFLINRKIREKGITATLFFSEPFDQEFLKLPEEVVEAFGLDVETFLEFTLKD